MSTPFWVVLAATALSSFFALTGAALRSFRRTQLEDAFRASGGAEGMERLARHLQALRLTTSLCRTLTNLVLVVAMLLLFGSQMSFWRSLAALAAAGSILAVFGVAIPQAWAAHGGEKVLAATLGVLLAIRYVLHPVTTVMAWFDVPVRRLSGTADSGGEAGETAKQEILQAASEGRAEGAVDADEMEMIESVMEFGQTQAGEIMTPRTDIFAMPIDLPWEEAVDRIVEAGHTRVPVYDGDMDNIVGILYAKDMLNPTPQQSGIQPLLRKAYFVPETIPLDELLRQFKARKVHMAVLLDEYGGTAGLVTIEDVIEEIVGDISDEYDRPGLTAIRRVDEWTVEVDGRFHVSELNDALRLDLPEDEDYDTVSGFVFSELGYIPATGETLESHGARLTVLAADERRITRLRVELLAQPGHDEQ